MIRKQVLKILQLFYYKDYIEYNVPYKPKILKGYNKKEIQRYTGIRCITILINTIKTFIVNYQPAVNKFFFKNNLPLYCISLSRTSFSIGYSIVACKAHLKTFYSTRSKVFCRPSH